MLTRLNPNVSRVRHVIPEPGHITTLSFLGVRVYLVISVVLWRRILDIATCHVRRLPPDLCVHLYIPNSFIGYMYTSIDTDHDGIKVICDIHLRRLLKMRLSKH